MNTLLKLAGLFALRPLACSVAHYSGTMRLGPIEGYDGRVNDIVYTGPRKSSPTTDLVVFFPGDIQNYGEQMILYPSKFDVMRWNLEAVAEILSEKLPTTHIIVVKPSRTEQGVYNYFDNFMTLNKFGGPDYLHGRFALPHLRHLINNVMKKVKPALGGPRHAASDKHPGNPVETCDSLEKHQNVNDNPVHPATTAAARPCDGHTSDGINTAVDINSIALVAFSKGCIVLNKLVNEIYLMSELAEEERALSLEFLQKVKEMAWLDGGHQGREGAWITNPNMVKSLVQTMPQLAITVHVTPYQMFCSARPWIGNECRRFVALCREASSSVTHTLHGGDHQPATLETHFLALQAYGAAD